MRAQNVNVSSSKPAAIWPAKQAVARNRNWRTLHAKCSIVHCNTNSRVKFCLDTKLNPAVLAKLKWHFVGIVRRVDQSILGLIRDYFQSSRCKQED